MGEGTVSWLATLSSSNQRQGLQLLWPSLSDLCSLEYYLLPGRAMLCGLGRGVCNLVLPGGTCGWNLKVLLNSG